MAAQGGLSEGASAEYSATILGCELSSHCVRHSLRNWRRPESVRVPRHRFNANSPPSGVYTARWTVAVAPAPMASAISNPRRLRGTDDGSSASRRLSHAALGRRAFVIVTPPGVEIDCIDRR